jgi:hypothetical protein
MRKRLKKPLTERAAHRQLFTLYRLKEAGHDPNASLIQSADHYWQDLYEPREVKIEPKPGVKAISESEARRKREAEHANASQSPEAHEARRRAMEAVRR